MKRGLRATVLLHTCLLVGLALACQPQTRQDRASPGPEVGNSPSDSKDGTAGNQPDAGARIDPNASVAPGEWENALKLTCEQGKASACSQLAYDALRARRTDEAIGFFTRACLMDLSMSMCAQANTTTRGLARACFELTALYQQKNRPDDANAFRKCACDRKFKLACL